MYNFKDKVVTAMIFPLAEKTLWLLSPPETLFIEASNDGVGKLLGNVLEVVGVAPVLESLFPSLSLFFFFSRTFKQCLAQS